MSDQSWRQARPPAQPAGWYTDPQSPARLRYFDGSAWTENTTVIDANAARVPATSAAPSRPSPPAVASPSTGGWSAAASPALRGPAPARGPRRAADPEIQRVVAVAVALVAAVGPLLVLAVAQAVVRSSSVLAAGAAGALSVACLLAGVWLRRHADPRQTTRTWALVAVCAASAWLAMLVTVTALTLLR